MDILYALDGLVVCFSFLYFLRIGAFNDLKLRLIDKNQYARNRYEYEKRVYYVKELTGKEKKWLNRELVIQKNNINQIKRRIKNLKELRNTILSFSAIIFSVFIGIFSSFNSFSNEMIQSFIQICLSGIIVLFFIIAGLRFCVSYLSPEMDECVSKVKFLTKKISENLR